jgi:aldose 1-epimerase
MTFNGGERGWGRTSLDIASHTANSITFLVFDRAWNGFPGTAGSSLTHTVTPYEWRIAYGITPTRGRSPYDLSQQVFWNLDGFAANSSRTIAEHTLHLPYSGLRLETDEYGIPTGDIKGNRLNSTYDYWSAARSLSSGLNSPTKHSNTSGCRNGGGYDDTFLISRSQPWNRDDHLVASLESPRSGIKVDLYTDQEALHVLTWNAPDGKIASYYSNSSLLWYLVMANTTSRRHYAERDPRKDQGSATCGYFSADARLDRRNKPS